MDLKLQGARCLVLGSSSGLGLAIATALAAEGARVAVTSRDADRGQYAATVSGAEASFVTDLREVGAGARVVEDAVAGLGGLDVCVVNTGGGAPGGIIDTDGMDEVAFNSMLRPALEVARAAAAPLRASGAGRLLFLTARSVLEASPDLALSSVMRSGVMAAARSLALELAPTVNVNVIATGQFDTPAQERFSLAKAVLDQQELATVNADHLAEIPLGRLGRAEELADVATFLCSPRASFVTGTVVRVDGGAVRGF